MTPKLLVIISVLFASVVGCRAQSEIVSSDKKYKAVGVSTNGYQYRVIEAKTGQILLTTHSQYPSDNEAKFAAFSQKDSRWFICGFHYSHAGNYTWLGIWDVTSTNATKLVKAVQKPGHLLSIPDSIFDEVVKSK